MGVGLLLLPLQASLLGPELPQLPLGSCQLFLQLGRSCPAPRGAISRVHFHPAAPQQVSSATYRPALRARASWMLRMSRWVRSICSSVWKSRRLRACLALLLAWYMSLPLCVDGTTSACEATGA